MGGEKEVSGLCGGGSGSLCISIRNPDVGIRYYGKFDFQAQCTYNLDWAYALILSKATHVYELTRMLPFFCPGGMCVFKSSLRQVFLVRSKGVFPLWFPVC